jgi:hypothetical protein
VIRKANHLLGTAMLNGNRYYAVFPDENPQLQLRMRALLDALEKLEKEFRQHIEQFRLEAEQLDGNKNQTGSLQRDSLRSSVTRAQ